MFKLDTPVKFVDAIGKTFKIEIKGHSATLFPMIHPDISRPPYDGDKRKMPAREKWSQLHKDFHIPALKKLLS